MEMLPCDKEKQKGESQGRIITGVRKGIIEKGYREVSRNVVERELLLDGKTWKIMTVYSQDGRKTMEGITERMEESAEGVLLMRGDWNERTGKEGGIIREMESKDTVLNMEGKRLINILDERGWFIVNGSKGEEGDYTYLGENGATVLDYVIGNQEAIEKIKSLKVGQRPDSDHLPLELGLCLAGEVRWDKGKKQEESQERGDWSEEGILKYHQKCKGWECMEDSTEGLWKEVKKKVQEARTKIRKRKWVWKVECRPWHEKEWKVKKREERGALRKWKKGEYSREEYKKWCAERRVKYERIEEEKIRNIRTEHEAWKYINKFRKKRERIEENIAMEKWREQFKKKLEGRDEANGLEEQKEQEREEGTETEISKEELITQLNKLKFGKAPGEGNIENEVWRYMSVEVGEVVWRLMRKLWRDGGDPELWRNGIITPIYKRGRERW